MRLAPGTPLRLSLRQDMSEPDRAVGLLAMAGQRAALEWGPALLANPLPVSPLLYPLESGLIEARGSHFGGLHGFLADSLPEGWGVRLWQRRLARHGLNWAMLNPVEQLALVGEGGRGALVYAPATTPPDDVATLDLDALAADARAMLLGDDCHLADMLATLGGASGGARPKINVGFVDDGRICIDEAEPSSEIAQASGYTSWIVKFPALADPVDMGPLEQAYATMARAAGVTMAETRLISAREGPAYFASRRFDRPAPGQRRHMVSLAGATEAPPDRPSLDYDGFLRATRAITRHDGDVGEAFTRMVFNILACNRDDHTRQHAYLMDLDGYWRLAPAYDLTWSEGAGGEHMLSIEGEGRSPTRAHVLRLAQRHGFSLASIDAVIDRVRAAVADWPVHAGDAGVGPSLLLVAARLATIDRDFVAS